MSDEIDPLTPQVPSVRKNSGRRFIFAGVLFGLFIFVFYAGYQKGQVSSMTSIPISPDEVVFRNVDKDKDATIDFSVFWKVWNLLKERYVDRESLDAKKLFYGAIDGMLAATGDPYTTFFDPQENQDFHEDMGQSFDGIGAEMQLKDGIVTVVAPLDGSPAEKSGIRSGDKILKIDGQTIENITLEEAVKRIRGPKGTSVTLTVYRSDDDTLHDIVVQRDSITVKSVTSSIQDGVDYIRLTRFGDETTAEFSHAVSEARSSNVQGIILDLRNNPGGYLNDAVDLAGYFVPSGSVVVTEENAEKKRHDLRSSGKPVFGDVPIVILINEGSASASEILAAALREDRDRVTLVGKQSYGKGSVQELIPVTSNTSVKITVAHWLTPHGEQINKVGIKPDVEVGLTRDDFLNKRDPQLDRAKEIMKEQMK